MFSMQILKNLIISLIYVKGAVNIAPFIKIYKEVKYGKI